MEEVIQKILKKEDLVDEKQIVLFVTNCMDL